MTDLNNVPPDKFVLFVDGDFFPVTNMYDRGEATTDPMRATSAVVYGGPKRWLVAPVSPGEIEKRETVEARLKIKLQH
jgi:hypothetical protein